MQQGAGQVEKQQLDAAKAMFELLFQIIDDGSGLVVGLSLRPDGVAFSLHAAFTPKSPTAGITSKEKPSALADLNRMPKGLTVYTGSAMSANVSSWTAKFYREFAAGDNDEAAQKAFDRWQDLAKDTVSTITAGNTDRSGITIVENANATKCVSELMAALKLAGEGMKYQNVPIKGKPIIKENDQTHDGVSLNKITLNFDFDAMANSLPQATRDQQIASMKLLLPETLTIWTGAKGDRVLQVVGKDWAAAKASLDQLKGRELIANNAQAKATRENLPAEVGSLSLFEVAGLVKTASEYVRGVAGALPGIPFNPDNLKLGKIAGEATYIGAAFTLKGNTGAVDIYIPYLSIRQIYDVVKPAIESMKGDGP
jgi:hypothetical protein